MHSLQKLRKRLYNWTARGIHDTPAVICDPASPLVVLSQSYHADLTMYLVAAKSFAHFLRPRHFVVVDDGLTDADRGLLRHHLGRVEFVRTADVDVGRCPRGGTWERLVTISRLCAEHYVVQLDSDTVTRAHPSEVLACAQANRSFTLGTVQGTQFVSVVEASRFVEGAASDHVQILAERAMARLPGAEQRRYVRGCSGFAGFARGAFGFEQLQDYSDAMVALLGRDSWSRWGSEQVSSNYIVANTPDATILPTHRYVNWVPSRGLLDACMLHFIGDHRFEGTQYIRQSRRIIALAGA